jgi:5'(3')-deoxyribonucleotidase
MFTHPPDQSSIEPYIIPRPLTLIPFVLVDLPQALCHGSKKQGIPDQCLIMARQLYRSRPCTHPLHNTSIVELGAHVKKIPREKSGKSPQTKTCMKTVLIEMEDILCDTSREVAKSLNLENPEQPAINTSGELAEIEVKEVEKFLETQPASFWEELPPTEELPVIKNFLKGSKVKVVTRPYNLVASQEGKKNWLKKHFPEADVVFTRSKHVFANEQTTLIDCKPAAIQAFKRFGGAGVLVPKPWQKNYKNKPLEQVFASLVK